MSDSLRPNAVVLVEGISDRLAVEALAARLGRDLAAEGILVVPIGGAQASRRVLAHYGPPGLVCEADLEDELVRCLGAAAVARIIEAQGESGRFETFRKQVEKRGLSRERQLHGFMWNRKIRYAPLLVNALDPERMPRPLQGVLEHVASGSDP